MLRRKARFGTYDGVSTLSSLHKMSLYRGIKIVLCDRGLGAKSSPQNFLKNILNKKSMIAYFLIALCVGFGIKIKNDDLPKDDKWKLWMILTTAIAWPMFVIWLLIEIHEVVTEDEEDDE